MVIKNREFRKYILEDCEMPKDELAVSSANELFDYILRYEGYGTYSGMSIRTLVEAVYGIDLSRYREYIEALGEETEY